MQLLNAYPVLFVQLSVSLTVAHNNLMQITNSAFILYI
jgi:hypothetical protein